MISDEKKRRIIHLAGKGHTLGQIRDELGIDHETFWRFRKANPDFDSELQEARQEGLEELADSLLTMPNDGGDLMRAKLLSDNIKWVLARRKAHVYGDKIDISVSKKVDMLGALNEAKARLTGRVNEGLLPRCYPDQDHEMQVLDILEMRDAIETDYKSVDISEAQDPNKNDEDIFT